MSNGLRILEGTEVLPPMYSAEELERIRERAESEAQDSGKSKKSKGDSGRFRVLNDFVDCTLSSLPKTDAVVWFVLWRDTRDGIARTAQSDIARRCGLCRRTVVSCLQRLRKAGLVSIEHQGGLTGGMSVYRLRGIPK